MQRFGLPLPRQHRGRLACRPAARRYLELPFDCDLTCYGNGIVGVSRRASDQAGARVHRPLPRRALLRNTEPSGAGGPSRTIRPARLLYGGILPAPRRPASAVLRLATRFLTPSDFAGLYLPQWSNALCEKRRELDVLAVGAYDGDTLVGLAGCSADCEGMWQIGIDVLPAYRRTGIASALTSMLAFRVLELGKIPFYCCAWSNVKSARNAIRSGFRPAWVQLTAKPEAFVRAMNENLT